MGTLNGAGPPFLRCEGDCWRDIPCARERLVESRLISAVVARSHRACCHEPSGRRGSVCMKKGVKERSRLKTREIECVGVDHPHNYTDLSVAVFFGGKNAVHRCLDTPNSGRSGPTNTVTVCAAPRSHDPDRL